MFRNCWFWDAIVLPRKTPWRSGTSKCTRNNIECLALQSLYPLYFRRVGNDRTLPATRPMVIGFLKTSEIITAFPIYSRMPLFYHLRTLSSSSRTLPGLVLVLRLVGNDKILPPFFFF
jgi:hypothetical protein